jgi:outer membrane murein-binding lipoprotein Lpp
MKHVLSLTLAALILVAAGSAFAGDAAKMQQLSQQIYAKQAELNAQMNSATPDRNAIETLASEIGALQGKLYAESVTPNAGPGAGGYGPNAGGPGYGPNAGPGYGPGAGGYGPGYGPGGYDCCNGAGPGMMGRGYGRGMRGYWR